MVVTCVHLVGVPLAFYPPPIRFSVGWYTVVIMNLAANSLVLIVLLAEVSKLYARIWRENDCQRLVIDVSAVGSSMQKIAPWGLFGVAQIRPPCASTIERQIDNPMPKPLAFVV